MPENKTRIKPVTVLCVKGKRQLSRRFWAIPLSFVHIFIK